MVCKESGDPPGYPAMQAHPYKTARICVDIQNLYGDGRCLDKAAIITTATSELATPNPWNLCSVTRVEEVKMLTGLLPIWATTIMFWTVYAQMASFSVQQALTMERSIGNFEIPPASFNVFMIGSIMLTLAIYDRIVMPLFRKTKKPQGMYSIDHAN